MTLSNIALQRLTFAVCTLLAVAAFGAPAAAQVVLLVNGDPITAFDIDQRSKLLQLQTHKAQVRQDVINELIDDRLKIQIGKKYGFEVPAVDVDNAFNGIGRRMRQTPEQFEKSLAGQGLHPSAMKSRIKAEITWSQIVRGKFQNSLQVGEKELRTALDARGTAATEVGYDYSLRPILFVVPRGAPDSLTETRKKEAEAFRARLSGCEESASYARSMRDVVVREMVYRNSSDLYPQLRQVMDAVEVGKITPPEVTQGGVEIFVLCAKTSTTADTPGKKEVRDEIYQSRFQDQAKRFLADLRKQAMIEYKK